MPHDSKLHQKSLLSPVHPWLSFAGDIICAATCTSSTPCSGTAWSKSKFWSLCNNVNSYCVSLTLAFGNLEMRHQQWTCWIWLKLKIQLNQLNSWIENVSLVRSRFASVCLKGVYKTRIWICNHLLASANQTNYEIYWCRQSSWVMMKLKYHWFRFHWLSQSAIGLLLWWPQFYFIFNFCWLCCKLWNWCSCRWSMS